MSPLSPFAFPLCLSASPILLAIAEQAGTKLDGLPAEPIRYKTALKVDDVLARLANFAASLPQLHNKDRS